ncbi:MAG: hypothetical protein ACFE78_06655 [Candidatus Hodarchaeota archaeon]
MSIHGNQYILPLFNTPSTIAPIKENDELALAFYLLSKDLQPYEKMVSFSRLLWPFLCIQGVIGTHIILDGLNVFSKEGKLTNPPRQPLIGHLLRNVENRTKIEQLNKIIEVLAYKDSGAEEIGEGEESEYQKLQIKGLINPEFLQSLVKLINLLEYKSVSDYMPLDYGLSTDEALNVAEKYRNIIDYMKGNAYRWNAQIELIEKEVEKWLVDLNVQLKDIETRYTSQITKTSQAIDSDQIREKLALESDKIDQWKVNEKKAVIESICVLFRTAERELEEIIKKNKFFTSAEVLKSKVFDDLTESFEKHFKFLIDEGNNFLDTINSLTGKYMELKERAYQIEDEAKRKLEKFSNELNLKLKNRDQNLSTFAEKKNEEITQIENLKIVIESLFSEIKRIIQTKNGTCLQEAKDLIAWSLSDNQAELFNRPIQWVYMPLYCMFVENENTLEEKLKFLFPGDINSDPLNIYTEISESMKKLKEIIIEKVEYDMALRSNFEFSCETKNLLSDKSFKKKLQQGISILRGKAVLNNQMETELREKLNILL